MIDGVNQYNVVDVVGYARAMASVYGFREPEINLEIGKGMATACSNEVKFSVNKLHGESFSLLFNIVIHELCHIGNKHTENMRKYFLFGTIFIPLYGVLVWLFNSFKIVTLLISVLVVIFQIEILYVYRSNEYEAQRFCLRNGFKKSLIEESDKLEGFMARWLYPTRKELEGMIRNGLGKV